MAMISKIVFDENTLAIDLNIDFDCQEVYIDKSTIGKDDNEKANYNFLAVGRKNNEAKKVIADLANHGFFLTHHKNGVSLFKKFINGESFSKNFDKNIQVWNDILYAVESPVQPAGECKLLVLFSSIADLPFNASISRRMFFRNFDTIKKYVPQNTYVLRIVDLGGVLGSFYLPSNFDPSFGNKIQELIKKVAFENTISDSNIILYGSSKGGTGALYHGLLSGYKTLAVDPIVSDRFYLEKHNDQHFVTNVFPESKDELFSRLMREYGEVDLSNIHIVTSPRSEQFESVYHEIILKNDSIHNYIFSNPAIKSHPDVAVQTLNFVTSMLNNLLYDLKINNNLNTVC